MTETMPTDEELRRWEAMAPGWSSNPAVCRALARLLAYVSHLRGEVESEKSIREYEMEGDKARNLAHEEERNALKAELRGTLDQVEGLTAERDHYRQAAADLRKQLEAASGAPERAVEAIVSDLSDRRGLKREWAQVEPEIQSEVRNAWAALIRAAMSAPPVESTVDEEARLSDPKRHPFQFKISGGWCCAHCGRTRGEHAP